MHDGKPRYRRPLARSLRLAAAVTLALALIAPAGVLADHCGGTATVTPSSGPPGTTFVFVANLGAASDLDVSHDGHVVAKAYLQSTAAARYEMTAAADSQGLWRMRAEVRGHPECAVEATFIVTRLPATSTAPISPERSDPSSLLTLAASLVGLAAALRRFRGPAAR